MHENLAVAFFQPSFHLSPAESDPAALAEVQREGEQIGDKLHHCFNFLKKILSTFTNTHVQSVRLPEGWS